MAQNTSTAVMARRHEPHDSLDFFPTPPWATRALVEHVLIGHGWRYDMLAGMSAWDPACGACDMVRPLREFFAAVYATDVHDYSMRAGGDQQQAVADFLIRGCWPAHLQRRAPDWIITNPPFRLAEQFITTALGAARVGIAMLVRTPFLEGVGRYNRLFGGCETKPYIVAPFAERVPMFKGRLDPKGSTATSYCWLVWRTDGKRLDLDSRMVWIPRCRRDLERPGDYPASAA